MNLNLFKNQQIDLDAWKSWERFPVKSIRDFHAQLEEYSITPLQNLNSLSAKLGLNAVWVKDESYRFGLNAYKALGGSFAIARFLQQHNGLKDLEFNLLHASNFPDSKDLIFATMTDGNHGLGVAYIASKLGCRSEIYVPKQMVPARIEAIKKAGGRVTVFEGGYDDAARQIAKDAEKYGWQVISDTAWEGYTQIPEWIIEGYSTLFDEAMDHLEAKIPTHIFIQAGVGSLASSLIQYFRTFYGNEKIRIIITEADHADCFYQSAKINDGKPHNYQGKVDTMMAGLACAEPNPIAWPILRDGADFMLSCPDDIAAIGMRKYYYPEKNDPRIISGESGAVTLGALYEICTNTKYAAIRSALELDSDSRVLLVNTEGDTDPVNFKKITI
jgi:diaminopropionate ammonia-lyase